MGQPDGADHIVCLLTVTADLLRRVQTDIAVPLDEPKEVLPVQNIQVGWPHRPCRNLIGLACHDCVQSEGVSRLCNPQDEKFSRNANWWRPWPAFGRA
jgi:hypothetical protein